MLLGRLHDAAGRLNPDLGVDVLDQAITQLLRAESQNALAENERMHRLITQGVLRPGRMTGCGAPMTEHP